MLCNRTPVVQQPRTFKTAQLRHQHSVVTCSATRRRTGVGSARARQPVVSKQQRELPNGQGVMLDEAVTRQDILYGQTSRQLPNGQGCIMDAGTFVITRPRRRSNYSLVTRPGAQVQQFAGRSEDQNLSLALSAMQTQSGMVPFLSDRIATGAVVIDTWAEDVTDVTNDAAAVACLGIVPYKHQGSTSEQTDPQQEAEWIVETSSSNPRRTQKVKFTCNLCGCTTISPVNPHAFHKGSLFARCGNAECGVIHKVKDNLKLFHEVRGPVFRPQRAVRLPRGLQRPRVRPGMRVGGVDILNSRSGTSDSS